MARPAVTAVCVAAMAVAGCSSGPATKADVCTSFTALSKQLVGGNGIIGNPLFHAADDLGDVAARYPGGSLTSDASALQDIADADSTSGGELEDATGHIANLCGHSLSVGAFLGGGS